jgi:hypothetical protein
MNSRTAGAALSFVVLVLVGSVRAADEPTRLPLTAEEIPAPRVDWYGLYMMQPKAKVGWVRIELRKKPDAYVYAYTMHLDLESMGQPMQMDMSESDEFDAAAPFAFRGGRSESKRDGVAQTLDVVKGKEGFTATSVQGGQTNTPPVPAIDFTLSDALASEIWFRKPRAVGDKIRVRSFSLSELKADMDTFVVTGRKEAAALGVPTVFYEAKVSSDSRGEEGIARTDAHGRLLSIVIGAAFEARLESEEEAKKTEKGGDLFVFGMAKLDKPIGDATNVSRLVLEVDGAGATSLVDAPRQSVARDAKSGVVTLSIGAEFGKDAAATPKEIEDALAETVDLPVKSPQVKALAAQAVGDAKTPREKVERLVHFVSEYVKDELCPGELSVPEIIEKKAGDCTEHALLFAALARAAGVPTREVGGLMYMGDEVQAFGGHEWDEVVLDGKWVAVDPSWNETDVDAGRVVTDREGKGMNALASVGQISFRLKDVRHVKEAAAGK